MSKLNKLLFILFLSLLIIIVSEIFYILTNKNSVKNDGLRTTKTGQPLHESVNTSSPEYKKMLSSSDRAIHPTVLKKLETALKSPDGGIYILQEYTAKVLAIESKGACVEDRRNGVLYPGEICFPFTMKLENKILPDGYTWVYLTEENIKKTKVYLKDKDETISATLQDIRPNDVISTVEKWDPSIPFDINKLKDYLDRQMVEYTIYINRTL